MADGDVGPGLSANAGVNVHQGVPPAVRANVRTGTPPGIDAGQPAAVARRSAPATAASGAWRIQLGAFGDRGRAAALWSRVAGRLGDAEPSYVPAGSVTRLQAGPYASRSAAQSACAAVRGIADCIVVGR
jgi:cell division septation protein DedD